MNRTLTFIASTAFIGLTACTQQPELNLPPKQDPLPEFTSSEKRNVLATASFMNCMVNQGGASIINTPWFNTLLEHCATASNLNEEMLHDVFDKFQNQYGHSWPDMVRELLAEENYSFAPGIT